MSQTHRTSQTAATVPPRPWRSSSVAITSAALQAYFNLVGLRRQERRERFEGLRIMERTTLRVWAARRERERP